MPIDHPDTGDVLSYIRAKEREKPVAKKIFSLGKTVATPAALELLERRGYSANALIARHAACDFGDLDAHDHQANLEAIESGGRIFSVYRLCDAEWLKQVPRSQRHKIDTLWVITNAQNDEGVRDATTVLTPSCY